MAERVRIVLPSNGSGGAPMRPGMAALVELTPKELVGMLNAALNENHTLKVGVGRARQSLKEAYVLLKELAATNEELAAEVNRLREQLALKQDQLDQT